MKIKLDGKLYDTPGEDDRLTLGEQQLLKREYNFVPAKDGVDLNDPEHLAAFLFMTLRKANSKAPANMLIQQIAQSREFDLVNDDGSPLTDDDEQQLADPSTPPASGGDAPANASAEAGS
jgi:hypothetical protein